MSPERRRFLLRVGGAVAIGGAIGVRLWNALTGPLLWGYDGWSHVAYVLFLDLYRALPFADQGWSYFHPPLHYLIGWLFAQARSAEVLLRGLALFGSFASLAVAFLAAWVTRAVTPERPGLSLLAFTAVAFLPVHLYVGPMPGNELTVTFFTSAAVAVFAVGLTRGPSRLRDVTVGALAGLALLSKLTGLIAAATVAGALGLSLFAATRLRQERLPVLRRGAILLAVALLVAGPYYARNFLEFGTPVVLTSHRELVKEVERYQRPGERTWRDFVNVSPGLFLDPDPLARHLVHSVWGSVYLNTWTDSMRASMFFPHWKEPQQVRRISSVLAVLGVVPTALALLGSGLAVRDVIRGRRRAAYGTLLLLSAASLVAFVWFAWQVPRFSALKASYLLNLSIPYGVFLARALEAIPRRSWRGLAVAGVGVSSAIAALVFTSGPLFRLVDHEAVGHAHYYFGDYRAARVPYELRIGGLGLKNSPIHWLENLAAVELADGNPERATFLYTVALRREPDDPYRRARTAVATALAGRREEARTLLGEAIAAEEAAEFRLNRGVIRAGLGDAQGARQDLERAVELSPSLALAWHDLAVVLEGLGHEVEAAEARGWARRLVRAPPRGYPHGVGTGEIVEALIGSRPLLRLEAGGRLALALPESFRRGFDGEGG